MECETYAPREWDTDFVHKHASSRELAKVLGARIRRIAFKGGTTRGEKVATCSAVHQRLANNGSAF